MISHQLDAIRNRLDKVAATQWVAFIEGKDFTSSSSFIMVTRNETRLEDIEISGISNDELRIYRAQ